MMKPVILRPEDQHLVTAFDKAQEEEAKLVARHKAFVDGGGVSTPEMEEEIIAATRRTIAALEAVHRADQSKK